MKNRKGKVQKTSAPNRTNKPVLPKNLPTLQPELKHITNKNSVNLTFFPDALLQHIFSFLIVGLEHPTVVITCKNFQKIANQQLKSIFKNFDSVEEKDKIQRILQMREDIFTVAKDTLKNSINFSEDGMAFLVRTEERVTPRMTKDDFIKYLEKQTLDNSFKQALNLIKAEQSLQNKIQKISHSHSSAERNLEKILLIGFIGAVLSIVGGVTSVVYRDSKKLGLSTNTFVAFICVVLFIRYAAFSMNRTFSRLRSKEIEGKEIPHMLQEHKQHPLTDQEKLLKGQLRLLKWLENPTSRPSNARGQILNSELKPESNFRV